jgi:hypothetical protein
MRSAMAALASAILLRPLGEARRIRMGAIKKKLAKLVTQK